MPLGLHLLIHAMLSLLAGLLVWRIRRRTFLSFFSALLGGVLVDFDHFIDYFLAFGWNFQMDYFTAGYQFLKSDKIYIFFHGWEYVIILLIAAWAFKNKALRTISLGLALGLFLHLSADVVIDGLPIKSYSLVYRAKNDFRIEKLVYPDHWQRHLEEKKIVNFK